MASKSKQVKAQQGKKDKRLGYWLIAIPVITFLPVVISWVVGMGTIGDHRFRLPTMSLSLFLQVIGIYALRHRAKNGSFKVAAEG